MNGSEEVREMLGSIPELWGKAGPVNLPDAAFNAIAAKFTKALEDARGLAQAQSMEPVAFINTRLEDLAEANALYGKDQRVGAPDKIARNDREISWLKNLRSMIALTPAPALRREEEKGYARGLADSQAEPKPSANPRFFIDHSMIHDRETGKHVTTEPDSEFCDGIERCCELLNSLSERREPRAFPLLFSSKWLEEKIKSDPDIECEAGSAVTSTSRGTGA